MSIVLDALNKADRENRNNISARAAEAEQALESVTSRYRKKILILGVLNFLTLGSVAFGIAWFTLRTPQESLGTEPESLPLPEPAAQIPPPVAESRSEMEMVTTPAEAAVSESGARITRGRLWLEGAGEIRIEGVFKGDSGASVMIDDEIYGSGDTVRGFRVVTIRVDRVTLEYGGELYEIPV